MIFFGISVRFQFLHLRSRNRFLQYIEQNYQKFRIPYFINSEIWLFDYVNYMCDTIKLLFTYLYLIYDVSLNPCVVYNFCFLKYHMILLYVLLYKFGIPREIAAATPPRHPSLQARSQAVSHIAGARAASCSHRDYVCTHSHVPLPKVGRGKHRDASWAAHLLRAAALALEPRCRAQRNIGRRLEANRGTERNRTTETPERPDTPPLLE